MIHYLVAIVVLLTSFHIFTRYSRKGRIVDKIPGYFAYPIIGNLLKYNTSSLNKFWETSSHVVNLYYPITRIWVAHLPIVSVRHPDDAEILLSSTCAIDKGCFYKLAHSWLKTGLLTSTGYKWRHRRNILSPAFHVNFLKKYLEIMNEEGEKFVSSLKNEEKESVKSLIPISTRLMLKVVTEAAMGVKLDAIDSETINKFENALEDLGKILAFRLIRPYIFNWMMKLPWKVGTVHQNSLKVFHDFTNMVIKERRDYHKSTQNKYLKILDDSSETGVNNAARKKRLAMLDLLLSIEQDGSIDHEGIKEELSTFITIGTDASSMALAYTLILLAENKEIQDRARKEATELLDRTKGKIEMDDLHSLDYVERCIKETLRLFPSLATIFRSVKQDLKLKNALVPGGSQVVLRIYHMHRDSNFWPEPEKYDPDRFLPENCQKRHPFAYAPFSEGPRSCIGYKFALLELKVIIARILYDFELESVIRSADIKLTADIVLRPAHPVSVKFVKIQK